MADPKPADRSPSPDSNDELMTCNFPETSVFNFENRSKPNAVVPPCWVCRTRVAEMDTQLNICVCFKCPQPGTLMVPVCDDCYCAHTKNSHDGLPFQGSWKLHERD
jgi:hypothetical protein